jgi:flagellar protein FlgJ
MGETIGKFVERREEVTSEQYPILQEIAAAAVACERETGCPAEITTAQCILESGWLKHAPGNNCFGIKDTDRFPGAQYVLTREFVDGRPQTEKLAFEVYPSLQACFCDHARLITGGFDPNRPNCYAGAWRQYQQGRELDRFIAAVAAHYATDPAYAQRVGELARGPNVARAIAEARAA